MIVRDSAWTSAVEGSMAAADALRGATDYVVEKLKDAPEYAEEILRRAAPPGASSGLSWPGSSEERYKVLFVPDDESREYLIFEASLSKQGAVDLVEEIKKHGDRSGG
jgi:hypothetical protein